MPHPVDTMFNFANPCSLACWCLCLVEYVVRFHELESGESQNDSSGNYSSGTIREAEDRQTGSGREVHEFLFPVRQGPGRHQERAYELLLILWLYCI